jgi:hypothetical protein
LRDPERARGTPDVSLFGHRHEVLDLSEAHDSILARLHGSVSVGQREIKTALDCCVKDDDAPGA